VERCALRPQESGRDGRGPPRAAPRTPTTSEESTTMTDLEHTLERTVLIGARRSTVFRYFTDSKRFAEWWGEGSRIEPEPGGVVLIRYADGSTASGEVVEVQPERPRRLRLHRRIRRALGAHRCRSAAPRRRSSGACRRCAALPGHGDLRLGRQGGRWQGDRARYQRRSALPRRSAGLHCWPLGVSTYAYDAGSRSRPAPPIHNYGVK